ncbi:MAG: hypothetical protein WDZ60_02350, partial [Wenzhouxiangellaceae bacterium]
RQAAKNAKDSGAGNSMLHERFVDPFDTLILPHSFGVLGVFASWREQKIDPEKINPTKCAQPTLFFPAQ